MRNRNNAFHDDGVHHDYNDDDQQQQQQQQEQDTNLNTFQQNQPRQQQSLSSKSSSSLSDDVLAISLGHQERIHTAVTSESSSSSSSSISISSSSPTNTITTIQQRNEGRIIVKNSYNNTNDIDDNDNDNDNNEILVVHNTITGSHCYNSNVNEYDIENDMISTTTTSHYSKKLSSDLLNITNNFNSSIGTIDSTTGTSTITKSIPTRTDTTGTTGTSTSTGTCTTKHNIVTNTTTCSANSSNLYVVYNDRPINCTGILLSDEQQYTLQPCRSQYEIIRDEMLLLLDNRFFTIINTIVILFIIGIGGLFFFLLIGVHNMCDSSTGTTNRTTTNTSSLFISNNMYNNTSNTNVTIESFATYTNTGTLDYHNDEDVVGTSSTIDSRNCDPRNYWYNWSIQVLNMFISYLVTYNLPWRLVQIYHTILCIIQTKATTTTNTSTNENFRCNSNNNNNNYIGYNLYGYYCNDIWYHIPIYKRLYILLLLLCNVLFQYMNQTTRIIYYKYYLQYKYPGYIWTSVFFGLSFISTIIASIWMLYEFYIIRHSTTTNTTHTNETHNHQQQQQQQQHSIKDENNKNNYDNICTNCTACVDNNNDNNDNTGQFGLGPIDTLKHNLSVFFAKLLSKKEQGKITVTTTINYQ